MIDKEGELISWVILLSGLVTSFYFVDLNSSSLTYSVLAPFGFLIFSIALGLKLVLNYNWARSRDNGSFPVDSDVGGGGDGGF